jgi:beta-lactamase regulating signal transducer with metallopeptidase domain
MIRLSELLATFVINAAWQIVVVCAVAYCGSLLLRNAKAKYRHFIWLLALIFSVLLPLIAVVRSIDSAIQPKSLNREKVRPKPQEFRSEPKETIQSTPNHNSAAAVSTPAWQSLKTTPIITYSIAITFALFSFYFFMRLVLSWRLTQKLRRSVYEPTISASLHKLIDDDTASLTARRPQLVCSDFVEVPLTVGTLKPLIILPSEFYEQQSLDGLRAIIGHEIAHIARHDFALNLCCQLLLIPVSFHPLTRLIKRQIDRTRELSCDELVTARLIEPESHARFLVEAADRLAIPRDQAFMLGVFDADILEERIMKLTQTTKRLGTRAGRALTVLATLFLCLSTLTVSTFSFSLQTRPGEMSIPQTSPAEAIKTQVEEQARLTSNVVQTERNLRATTAQERAQAACEAGKRRSLASIPQLISMLGDNSRIEQIDCWSNGDWSPALNKFKSPSPGEQAAIALASMGPVAFGPLTEALGSSDTNVRRNAAWAIGELTNMERDERADAVPALTSLLNDADGWTRAAAARSLGELSDLRATERLTIALLDGDANVRRNSAWALGEMKFDGAVEQLCNVLVNDLESGVRLEAATALGEIGSSKAIASLKQALSDSEPKVRAKVKWAIEEIEDSEG